MNRKEFIEYHFYTNNLSQLVNAALEKKYGNGTRYAGMGWHKLEFIIEGDWDKKDSLSFDELILLIDDYLNPLYATLKPTMSKTTKIACIF